MAKFNRKIIDSFFKPQDNEEALWKEAIFVFDSSSLLYLYEYSDKAKINIIKSLSRNLKKRLWIPNHVAYEYLKNRERVIESPIKNKYGLLKSDYIKPISSEIKKTIIKLNDFSDKVKKQDMHPHLNPLLFSSFKKDSNSYEKKLDLFQKEIEREMLTRESEIKECLKNDIVLDFLEESVEVGKEYNITEVFSVIKESNFRFPNKIAPGWKDENEKQGIQRVGDLIIWKQMLDYSKENNKPIILVTNDVKIDWCHIKKRSNEKRIIRPCKELIKEMKDIALNNFWMYTFKDFLHKSNELIKTNINEETLNEVKEIEEIKNYKKSIELALNLGYKKIKNDNSYNGFFYKKNSKIWIYNIDLLKEKLEADLSTLIDLGYDVDAYYKYIDEVNE